MSSPIAVNSCSFTATNNGSVTILSGLSVGTTIGNSPICLDGLNVMLVGGTLPGGFTQTAPVTISISATGIIGTKVENKAPLTVGDNGTGTVAYVGPNGATASAPATVTIADAGQVAVTAS